MTGQPVLLASASQRMDPDEPFFLLFAAPPAQASQHLQVCQRPPCSRTASSSQQPRVTVLECKSQIQVLPCLPINSRRHPRGPQDTPISYRPLCVPCSTQTGYLMVPVGWVPSPPTPLGHTGNTPPQGLCTGCSLKLDAFPPESHVACHVTSFMSLLKCEASLGTLAFHASSP